MHRRHRLTLYFLLFSLLASCNSPAASPTPTVPPPTPTSAPSDTPTPAPTPTADLPPRTGYILDLTLDYASKTAQVQETIVYPNRTGGALTDVLLAIEPGLWYGGFTLTSATANGQPITTFDLNAQRLDLTLPQTQAPGTLLTLALNYALILPKMSDYSDPNDTRPQIYGYSAGQVNLVDWYPFIVPYLPGSGWVLHNPWFYGEHLVYDAADFDVSLRFSDPAFTPVVAASGEEIPANDGKRYRLENARNFAFSMSSQYVVKTRKVGGVTVTSYSFPVYEKAGQAVLDESIEAIGVFSKYYGPYPYKTLSAVQGDFNDGMEFSGLYFLGHALYNFADGTAKNDLARLAAHETAHQWWFSSVGDDQALEPWLDEGFAVYSERLYYEFAHPEFLKWWQTDRVDFYQPKGRVDIRIYDGGGYRPYQDAVYLRGALFLQAVRERIGDADFFAFLRDYYAQEAGHRTTADEFFRILRLHSNADLTDIIQNYFQNPH